MEIDKIALLQTLPIGLCSGLLSGSFGVGGGIVAIPLLRHFLGLSAHVAIGSSLAVILPTAIVGSISYFRSGQADLRLALVTGVPAILGTVLASHHSQFVEEKVLLGFLFLLMMAVGSDYVFDVGTKLKSRNSLGGATSGTDAFVQTSDGPLAQNSDGHLVQNSVGFSSESPLVGSKLFAALLTGFLIGIISGFLGIGGGFIMVPSFCYFFSLPLKKAFGTSLLVVAVVSLPGTVVHAMHNHVDLAVALPMIAASIPGAWLGSRFALRSKERLLKVIFGSLLIVSAAYLLCKEFAS